MAKIQVFLVVMDPVEVQMMAVGLIQSVVDTIFLFEVGVFTSGPLWMMDPEEQEPSFHISTLSSFSGRAREPC